MNWWNKNVKNGEYALCWRQINEDYYEYYIPTVYYTPEGINTEEEQRLDEMFRFEKVME